MQKQLPYAGVPVIVLYTDIRVAKYTMYDIEYTTCFRPLFQLIFCLSSLMNIHCRISGYA